MKTYLYRGIRPWVFFIFYWMIQMYEIRLYILIVDFNFGTWEMPDCSNVSFSFFSLSFFSHFIFFPHTSISFLFLLFCDHLFLTFSHFGLMNTGLGYKSKQLDKNIQSSIQKCFCIFCMISSWNKIIINIFQKKKRKWIEISDI